MSELNNNTNVLKATNNNALEKFQGKTAFLNYNGNTYISGNPCLMIKKSDSKYYVNGIIGFGGQGYSGYLSTQKVMKILKGLGFNIKSQDLNKWISA